MSGRGASLAKRLDACACGLDALEAGAAGPRLARREHTDEEIVGIGLVLLAHVHDGDVGAFAEYLARDAGMPFEEAEEVAETLGRILEDRRKTAPNPRNLA